MDLFAVTFFLKFAPVDISLGEGEVEFEVLEVLQFDSTRKRMSVITRNPNNKELVMFTKGADTAVLGVLHKKFKGRYCGVLREGEGKYCSTEDTTKRVQVSVLRGWSHVYKGGRCFGTGGYYGKN